MQHVDFNRYACQIIALRIKFDKVRVFLRNLKYECQNSAQNYTFKRRVSRFVKKNAYD